MRALRIDAHGGAEVMRLVDAPMPQPGAGEVLVKVSAASINPIDWKMRNGEMRPVFPFPLPRILGRDFAGTVAGVGEGVTDLEPGTRVFGAGNPTRDGTHAEYVVAPRALMARTPAALTDVQAATIPVAGVSALIPLVEVANVQAGQRVLIHAGAGGVGTFAVQIARHMGAEALATAGSRNIAYVTKLGAHRVIDYSTTDFATAARDCDVVLDTLGGDIHRRSFSCLRPGGVLVGLSAAPIDGPPPRGDVRVIRAQIQSTEARLAQLAGWAVTGTVLPQVSGQISLQDAQSGYAASEGGHTVGKIVLTMG
jgi:NADPH:quinone reductase-like Zn-dependent oxidoreductase